MKRIYLSIFMIIIFGELTSAQWTNAGHAFAGQVRGLYFESNNTGYAVGGNGLGMAYIAKTTDGGATWAVDTFEQSPLLRAINFVNHDTGFACGSGGVLFKTTDAGNSWSLVYKDSTQYFRTIDFVSSKVGYMGGALGTIWKTEDGGNNWTMYSLSQNISDVIQLQMADVNTGYAVCSEGVTPFANGYIFKTTNGGSSWSQMYYDAATGLLGLAVVNTEIAYAGGINQVILKTADGGGNWNTMYSGLSGVSVRAGFAVSEQKIFMVDDGYNAPDGSKVISSTDSGITWKDTTVGNGGLYTIYFPSVIRGYTGDAVGNIYKIDLPCPVLAAPSGINGITVICAEDSASFSISPVVFADSYQWQVPADATIISGQGDTTVSVLFGSTSGDVTVTSFSDFCGFGGTASLAILVNPLPPAPLITFASGVLSSSATSGNQWYFNGTAIPGATDQNYSPTQDGTYTVIVTDNSGCSSQSAPFEVVGIGISELSDQEVLVYPNPFETSAAIMLPLNSFTNCHVIITDVSGKVVSSLENINGDRILVLRGTLSSGIYFFRLFDKQNGLIARGKLIAR